MFTPSDGFNVQVKLRVRMLLQMDRASSHPMSFKEVATALREVSGALDSGATPAQAEAKAR